MISESVFEQVKWERDVALSQLEEIGKGLGEKMDDIKALQVNREKKILDVTCGNRTIWFQKEEPHTIYCDKRMEEHSMRFGKATKADGTKSERHLNINPDVQCDFTDLPFADNTFSLVVFDPPHVANLKDCWTRKMYGTLGDDWKQIIHDGFTECMRVLKPDGVLIFKWCDVTYTTKEVIEAIGQEPLFGHRSGKKMNTHWMCYMKLDEQMP